MNLIERVIRALIYIAVLVLCVFLIFWFLSAIGLLIPFMVERIVWVIVALIAILVLVRLFWPLLGGYDWWGDRRGPP
jgi:hypothetical protein